MNNLKSSQKKTKETSVRYGDEVTKFINLSFCFTGGM